jgi:hypothetical protein
VSSNAFVYIFFFHFQSKVIESLTFGRAILNLTFTTARTYAMIPERNAGMLSWDAAPELRITVAM